MLNDLVILAGDGKQVAVGIDGNLVSLRIRNADDTQCIRILLGSTEAEALVVALKNTAKKAVD